ncbi:MAG: HAMP domain-containing protein [Pseudolabrys sp.]
MKLPTLSIAARLYAIFALMAATTVALSVYAVSNARFHAALTEEFESANAGSWNVERGIYMSADVADAASARNDRNPSQRQRDGAASVTGPISDITSVTEAVAAGDAAITIPFTDRRDEIGALARSIGIFQTAMRKNVELNRTVLNDADLRQQHMAKRNRSFIFGGRGNACRAWTNFRRDARSVDATRERCRQCLSQDRTCRGVIVRSVRQRPRHCFG